MKINGNKVKINPRINSLLIQKVERSGKEDGQNLRVFPERRQELLAVFTEREPGTDFHLYLIEDKKIKIVFFFFSI